MLSRATASAATRHVVLYGRRFALSPLSVRQFAEYEAWLQELWRQERIDALADAGINDDALDAEAACVTVESEHGRAMGCRTDSQAFWLWLHARGESFAELAEWVRGLTDTREIDRATSRVNGSAEIRRILGESSERSDMAAMYQAYADRFGWTPNQVADMTPAQLAMYAGKYGASRYVKCKTIQEAMAILSWSRNG